jgi:ribosomal protein S18 acetylase RimI-like enzyme
VNQRVKNAMLQIQENSIELRSLEDGNRLQVAQFFHDVWHETQAALQPPEKAKYRDLAFFLERMNGRAHTVIAFCDKQIAGFVSWTDNHLNSLFVHGDVRNSGVGLKLMRNAEASMFAAGQYQLELDCVYGNDAAKRFYERHGWKLDCIATDERDKPEGVIFTKLWIMVKSRAIWP